MTNVLDNPIWHALTGPQRAFAIGDGRARRYRGEVAPFAAVADDQDPAAWRAVAELGSDVVVVIRPQPAAPPGWTIVQDIPAAQFVYDSVTGPTSGDADIVALGRSDVPQMLELVELTKPGPFRAQTVDLGGYRGVRDGDELVAMAGYRMQPDGWVEISAVCTHPDYRGQGLARQLIQSVLADVHQSGRRAFLHVASSNARAAAVYRDLGFTERRDVFFLGITASTR